MVTTIERPITQTFPKQGRTLYELWPTQAKALRLLGLDPYQSASLPIEELLYGGQAGGGKSHLLRAVGVTVCLRWPGAVIPLFRRSYPELEDSHIRWVQQEIPREIAVYNQVRHELKFANGSSFLFRHANDDAAVLSYLTAEWAGLLIDQAEQFSPYQIQLLRTRVRQPVDAFGGTWRPVIVYSANPGGPAHQYLRDGFVDAGPSETPFEAPENDGGLRRYYLPARLSDNPSLNATDYRRLLQGLPEHLVKAYMEGDWAGVVGAYFSQFRARDLEGEKWHVWTEAEIREHYHLEEDAPFPPESWVKWCGVDGGVRDPWCVIWLTRAPDRRVIAYRETYARGIEIPEQARTIRHIAKEHGEVITRFLADPAMFANRANLSVSDFQVYAREGVPLTRGNNKREQGWRRVSELLSHTLDDCFPQAIFVQGACPQLVKTLPLLMVDELHREDVSSVHGRQDPASPSAIRDDSPDAYRYGITPTALPDPDRTPRPLDTRMPGVSPAQFDPSSLGQTGLVSEF